MLFISVNIHSFIFSKHLILVTVVGHSVPIPETLSTSSYTPWIGSDDLSHIRSTIFPRMFYGKGKKSGQIHMNTVKTDNLYSGLHPEPSFSLCLTSRAAVFTDMQGLHSRCVPALIHGD